MTPEERAQSSSQQTQEENKVSSALSKYHTSPAKKEGDPTPKIAIGVSTFQDLVSKSTIFIDKTLLIKEFLEHPVEIFLITSPRRFCKSINLDMIKTFFEINMKDIKIAKRKETTNFKLFQGELKIGNKKISLTHPLNIAIDQDIIENFQGNVPVISIDFKDVKGNNYQTIEKKIKKAIYNTYGQHSYLINVFEKMIKQDIHPVTRIDANKYLNDFKMFYEQIGNYATTEDIQSSFVYLTKALFFFFKKKVIILMDEYDAPINSLLESNSFTEEDFEKTVSLLRGLMSETFKSNKLLFKGLINGILTMAKNSLLSDFNNTATFTFADNEFAGYYSFNENDINNLFKAYNINDILGLEAKQWYGGYRIVGSEMTFYNPWSIIMFLSKKRISDYMENSSSNSFLNDLFQFEEIKNNIISLMKDVSIQVNLKKLMFDKTSYLALKKLLFCSRDCKIDEDTINILFSFLFAVGFLTFSEIQKDDGLASLRIPNIEVKMALAQKLVSFYSKEYAIQRKYFDEAIDNFEKLVDSDCIETSGLKQSLENLFAQFQKFIDIRINEDIDQIGIHGDEDIVHSAINYLILQIRSLSKYGKFGSEVSYGKKRPDIIILNQKKSMALVIELKYNKSAENALQQALDYKFIFEKWHLFVKTIKYIGINVTKEKKVNILIELKMNKQ